MGRTTPEVSLEIHGCNPPCIQHLDFWKLPPTNSPQNEPDEEHDYHKHDCLRQRREWNTLQLSHQDDDFQLGTNDRLSFASMVICLKQLRSVVLPLQWADSTSDRPESEERVKEGRVSVLYLGRLLSSRETENSPVMRKAQ